MPNTHDFSLLKFVDDLANKKQEYSLGAKEAMNAVDKRFVRGSTMGVMLPMNSRTVSPDASGLVKGKTLLERLRTHSLFMRAGARHIGDQVRDAEIVSEDRFTECGWPKPGATLTSPDATEWSSSTVPPLHVYAELPVSFQMLNQTGQQGEDYFADLLMRSLSNELDRAILRGDGEQATTFEPVGLLENASITANSISASITYDHILTAETAAMPEEYEAPTKKYGYMLNTNLRKTLLQTPRIPSGDNTIMFARSINGHPAHVTSHVPASSLLFGNFYDLMILQWSGIDLIVNKYSYARQGYVLITAGMWVNIHVANTDSFYRIEDIT